MEERNSKLAEAYDTVLAAERDKLQRLEDEMRLQQAVVETLMKRVAGSKMQRRKPLGTNTPGVNQAAQPTAP